MYFVYTGAQSRGRGACSNSHLKLRCKTLAHTLCSNRDNMKIKFALNGGKFKFYFWPSHLCCAPVWFTHTLAFLDFWITFTTEAVTVKLYTYVYSTIHIQFSHRDLLILFLLSDGFCWFPAPLLARRFNSRTAVISLFNNLNMWRMKIRRLQMKAKQVSQSQVTVPAHCKCSYLLFKIATGSFKSCRQVDLI